MNLTKKQRRILLVALFISAGLLILMLIGVKSDWLLSVEISRFELGALLIVPLLSNFIILLLIYDTWFQPYREGALNIVKKIFFCVLIFGSLGIWTGIFWVFVF